VLLPQVARPRGQGGGQGYLVALKDFPGAWEVGQLVWLGAERSNVEITVSAVKMVNRVGGRAV